MIGAAALLLLSSGRHEPAPMWFAIAMTVIVAAFLVHVGYCWWGDYKRWRDR